MTFTTMRLFLASLLLLFSVAHALPKFMMSGNMNDKGNKHSPPSENNKSDNNNNEPPPAAAAMTCDAMMAKSLVAANEATAMAEAERDQFFQDLESMTLTAEQVEQELKETTQDLTQRLFQANEQQAKITKEFKQALQELDEKWKGEMEESEKNMALLRDRSERAIYEGQQDAARRIKLQKEQHEQAIKEKNAEVERIKVHYDQLADAVRAEATANITSVVTQSSAVTAALKEELKLNQQKSTELLEATKTEATERMEQQEKENKQKLSVMEGDYTAKLEAANDKINDLTKKLKDLEKERSTLEKKYKAASEEVSRWEQLYGSRSYCNFTYIQEDTVAAAVATQKVVVDEAIRVADKATKATQKLVETSVKKAEPHVQKTRALVQKHVQPQVDKTQILYKEHMKPHVDKYIVPYAVPLWEKASILLNKAWVEAKELAKKTHAKVVASYKKSCPGTLKRLKEMEHAPKSMVDHVKQSCREPERTVNIFLWTLLFISVIVFRSFLWRNLVALALLPFQIVWFFCPLRLVFGKGKQSVDDELSEDETPVASPVKLGPSKKVPPQ